MKRVLGDFSNEVLFEKTALAREFRTTPLGFVDVGSAGEIHPIIRPLASFARATLFEPDRTEAEKLRAKLENEKPFAEFNLHQTALYSQIKKVADLYLTKASTNHSLVKPNPIFRERYAANQFEEVGMAAVETTTLDTLLVSAENKRVAEFIKLDTQGTEYEILMGAKVALREQCMAIWCEVEFLEVYEGQKTFSDVDQLLRSHGFALYGLYPHYRSTKALDRKRNITEERLMWADAIFFKDPLDRGNRDLSFSPRDILVLIAAAITTQFFDFALELSRKYLTAMDRTPMIGFIEKIATGDGEGVRKKLEEVSNHCARDPNNAIFYLERLIDAYRSNTSVEHVETERAL